MPARKDAARAHDAHQLKDAQHAHCAPAARATRRTHDASTVSAHAHPSHVLARACGASSPPLFQLRVSPQLRALSPRRSPQGAGLGEYGLSMAQAWPEKGGDQSGMLDQKSNTHLLRCAHWVAWRRIATWPRILALTAAEDGAEPVKIDGVSSPAGSAQRAVGDSMKVSKPSTLASIALGGGAAVIIESALHSMVVVIIAARNFSSLLLAARDQTERRL